MCDNQAKFINFQERMNLVTRWSNLAERFNFDGQEKQHESTVHRFLREIMEMIKFGHITPEQHKEADQKISSLEE